MATFLDNLSQYNAKAAVAIEAAGASGDYQVANQWTALKNLANDPSISDDERLLFLTALINSAGLLDVAIAPYFPSQNTPTSPVVQQIIHNGLAGIQGGAPGDYQHLTTAQVANFANKAGFSDIRFSNLLGTVSENAALVAAFASKQEALSGNGFVKIAGSVISYDNSTYLATIAGIAAGGELSGTYPNPTLLNEAVVTKTMGPGYAPASGTIGNSTTIRGAIQILDNAVSSLISTAGTVTSVNVGGVPGLFTSSGGPVTTSGTISLSLVSQVSNLVYASPNGSTGAPAFRPLVNNDLPNSGVTAGTYGSGSAIPVVTVNSKGVVTAITTAAAPGGGTVTSVGLAAPSQFSISGSPVTGTGTLSFQWSNQAINLVLASPASGSAGLPLFRSLVSNDIPSLAISKITGLQAALDSKLEESLQNGQIWIGNASNAPVAVTPSGDWTITNTGVATIANAAVSFAKFQNIAPGVLLGRWSPTNGPMQQITIGAGLNLNSSTGVLTSSGGSGGVPGGTSGEIQWNDSGAFGGIGRAYSDGASVWVEFGSLILADDAATPVNTVTLTGSPTTPRTWTFPDSDGTFVGTGAIINSGLSMATARILGRSTAGAGAIEEITIGSGLSLTSGVLSATGGGSGTVTSVSVVTANGFAGTVATPSTTPAITLTTTITGVLKGNGTAISAAASGADYVAPGAITGSGLTMSTGVLLGRSTAGSGAIEEITVGSGLSLSGGVLTASGGGGGVTTVNTFSASAQANGATISGVTITFGPASSTVPGMVGTGAQTFAGVKTFAATNAIFTTATATQDGIIIQPRAGGSSSFRTTITTGALTASRTWTIPEVGAAATFAALEGTQTFSGAKTFSALLSSSVGGNAITILSGGRYSYNVTGTEVMAMDSITVGSGAYVWRLNFWNGTTTTERLRIYNSTGAPTSIADDTRLAFGLTSATHKVHIKDTFTGAAAGGSFVGGFFLDSITKTSLTASTECVNFHINNNYTWTWLAGLIATQRHALITAPTYAFASASTITNAATLAVSGAPVAGTNATITNPMAFWVQAGRARFDGPGSWSGLPIGNIGLSSGDLYVDTAANILSNGDLVVGRKV